MGAGHVRKRIAAISSHDEAFRGHPRPLHDEGDNNQRACGNVRFFGVVIMIGPDAPPARHRLLADRPSRPPPPRLYPSTIYGRRSGGEASRRVQDGAGTAAAVMMGLGLLRRPAVDAADARIEVGEPSRPRRDLDAIAYISLPIPPPQALSTLWGRSRAGTPFSRPISSTNEAG